MRPFSLFVLPFLIATGCGGGSAPGGFMSDAGPSLPRADLSSDAFGYGRAEFRMQGRMHYVAPFMGNADIFGGGLGEGVVVAYRSPDPGEGQSDILFELALERSSHEEVVGARSAEYWRAAAGFRFVQTGLGWVEPFMAAGGSMNRLSISGGDMVAGYGAYVGVGVEVLPYPWLSAGIEATYNHFWNEYTDGGEAASASVAASVGLRF